MEMPVSGNGDGNGKDGNVLLQEMHIARVTTAQDDDTGDGTTSNVLVLWEAPEAGRPVCQRIIVEGFEAAKDKAPEALEQLKVTRQMERDTLIHAACTSLMTKVCTEMDELLTEQGEMQER